ncbi:hypothetical protein KFK09_011664 [Dendrobium nobile]|uniref:Uncharacterized protein n=1 Tax=Dendrobium nobile TaxID=94219 RepID=A0A8T3BDH9_DENNO|nr:hypothetical protein KFK09_011664 [Dendrobium nobile]
MYFSDKYSPISFGKRHQNQSFSCIAGYKMQVRYFSFCFSFNVPKLFSIIQLVCIESDLAA